MNIQPLEILKWIGIVLAAGFIGYFGRYLAMLILEKIHKRKTESPAADTAGEITAAQANQVEESRLKLEKRRAEQEAKKAKKAQKK